MAGRVLDPEERRHLLQPAMTQLGHEAACQSDRAQRRARGRRDPRRRAFACENAPVEAGVVGDEDGVSEHPPEAGGHVREARASRHQPVGDPGQPHHRGGNGHAGIEQRVVGEVDGPALEHRDRHFENPPAGQRAPRRFEVHDREATVIEREHRRATGHPAATAASCSAGRRHPGPARSPPW